MATAEVLKEEDFLLEAFKSQEYFVRCLIDAWVLIDATGKVIKANQLFSQLVGESSRKILKVQSINELIKFSVQDAPFAIADIQTHSAPTRIDEVSGWTPKRENLTLILGICPYIDESTNRFLGAFLLVRDVTDDKMLHDKYKTTKTDSITDNLTGLYTRRHFEGYLTAQQTLARSENKAPIMSLIMIDIDHFKKVNDVYGHAAGDAVLKITGELMANGFRKSDISCRYGGEEFLVILPHTNLQGAGVAAEQLRKTVEARKFVYDGIVIPVTISSGVATIDLLSENYQEALVRADAALYDSKKNGRNQVNLNHGANNIQPFKPAEKKTP